MTSVNYEQTYKLNKTAAIIILYLPSNTNLVQLLKSVQGTVNQIFVIDNTPTLEIAWANDAWFRDHGFVIHYEALGDNFGIAKAQNVGIEMALQAKCDHVIFFDQDSEASFGMVEALLAEEQLLLRGGVHVGSVGPVFIDQKTGTYDTALKQGFFFVKRISIKPSDKRPIRVDFVISSGSLIRLAVLHEVGGMMEKLFIDFVDIEWALRASSMKNYKHFMLPNALMLHSIGDSMLNVGVRKINIHNDTRKYYIIRNACYLAVNTKIKLKWRVNTIMKIPIYWFVYLISSKNKNILAKLLFKAVQDGFAGRLGKLN